MSPEFWLGIAGLILPIVGWLIYHVMHDREVQSDLKGRTARNEQDISDLRKWKHVVVDPYIPGAMNAQKERIDRIERRVFNGHKTDES